MKPVSRRLVIGALALVAVVPVLTLPARAEPEVSHRLLAADKGRVAILNKEGVVEWEVPNPYVCHDIAMLPNGNVLFPTSDDTIVEMTPEKKIVWQYTSRPTGDYKGPVQVHAFQRLPHDVTMIAETGNRRLIEVDRDGKILREVPLTVDHPNAHRDTRRARKLDNGNYLVCHEADATVREYDPTGKVVWSHTLDLHGRERTEGHAGHGTEVFNAIRLKNGNTMIAGGNNNRVIEVTPDGKEVWTIEHDELPGIELHWVTSLQQLPNGNLIVGNTHAGPENPQMFEVTRDKKVVWTFKNFDTFGNDLCASQVLDVKGHVIR
jgi:hypothetical protein